MSLPVSLEEIVEGFIIDINHEGNGVLKYNDFTIFTDNGVIGDKVKVSIIGVRKNFAIGKTIEILNPSKARVESKCLVSDTCGGCQLQSMEYDEQLKFKKDKVINDIKRIGKLDNIKVEEVIGSSNIYRYRNNVQIPVGYTDGKVSIGHYEKGSHRIVDTKTCIIQDEVADKVVDILREFIREYKIKTYNRKNNSGTIKHIIIKTSRKSKDTMVIIVTNTEKLAYKEELIKTLINEIPEIKSIIHNINKKRRGPVLGNKSNIIYGEEKIVDKIGGIEFRISPESFFQVNTDQAKVMYDKVLEYADLSGKEVVIDLYSGIGSIALSIANGASMVYGVEVSKEAIEDAKENMKLNNIKNVGFFNGRAEEILPQLKDQGIKSDLIIVDPPRRGCEKELLDTIIEMEPPKFIYVSCNPSTLARDLKYLDEKGYKVKVIQPIDMFPQTTHVECVTLLTRG